MRPLVKNSQNLIQTIKEDVDIVEYIGQYVNLEKKGKSYLGLCPFHNEKTPSFHVNPEYKIFNCFGCNKSGSVIDFVMEHEHQTIRQATETLARHLGIKTTPQAESLTPEHGMMEMHDFITKMYHYVLVDTKEGEPALEYLLERGFTLDIIKRHFIGLAPAKPGFTVELLEKRNMNLELAFRGGLIGRAEDTGQYYDKFRARIMIPIKNHQGEFIGFTARSLDGSHPKYINTSETPIFKKQQILFNLSDARRAISEVRELVIMEGHLDVVKVKRAGVMHVVGLMGTALSDSQVDTIRSLTDNVTLMFDGDEAGRNAQIKYGERLLKSSLNPYILPLPDGLDPDDYIETHGFEKFQYFVRNGKMHYLKYLADALLDDSLSNDIRFNENVKRLKQLLTFVKDEITHHRLVEDISAQYKISPNLLITEVYKKPAQVRPSNSYPNTQLFSRQHKEEQLLKMFLMNPDLIDSNKEQITSEIFTLDANYGIFKKLVSYRETHKSLDIPSFLSTLETHEQDILLRVNQIKSNVSFNQSIIDDYIHDLSGIRNSKKEKSLISAQLEAAYKAADIDEIKRLTEQYRAISARHKN